jgi:glycosyltransferase involved in cell wall biosynthesis
MEYIKSNKPKLKIGLYSPYLSMLGGGERYILSIAEVLSHEHDVTLFADFLLKTKIQKILNLPLSSVKFQSENNIRHIDPGKRFTNLSRFDVFFFTTDGSLFLSGAKKNYIIIQSPVHIPKKTVLNTIKLTQWKILCYSEFMKTVIEGALNKPAEILSPCIPLDAYSFKKDKSKTILTVGRFFAEPHSKKQDILVKIFKSHANDVFKGWKLVIAGGLTEKSGDSLVRQLRHMSVGCPIDIRVNISYQELISLYSTSAIYWHAAGFGEDINKHPERAEHFGITTLEAMISGAVPIVYNAGGQKDIVSEGFNGFLWSSEDELVNKTKNLIHSPDLYDRIQKDARSFVKKYSCEVFYEKVSSLIF